MANGVLIADTPEKIAAFRLLSLRGRLQLELKGLRFKGGSTFSVVKREFNLKGSRGKVLEQFNTILRDRGILPCEHWSSALEKAHQVVRGK
jgi:hypothetical protein